jgi:transaldolase
MKFFLDTANLDEIRKGAQWGIVDGVTTNPTLIAKEGRALKEQIAAICDIVDGPISAEVVATEAYFISPFVGRLDDVGTDGMALIRQIVAIYKNYSFGTQVLAASLRHPMHVIDAALAGSHIGTMPFKVLDMLFNHPLTDKGLEQFLSDYRKVFGTGGAV